MDINNLKKMKMIKNLFKKLFKKNSNQLYYTYTEICFIENKKMEQENNKRNSFEDFEPRCGKVHCYEHEYQMEIEERDKLLEIQEKGRHYYCTEFFLMPGYLGATKKFINKEP